MTFESIINTVDGWVWGWVLIGLILAVGLYLTVRTRFVQVRYLGRALKYMVKNEDDGVGEVSSFGALCTALSATIGTGNIVGVATAIVAGGPGALLWMLVAAFFGMATKYAEGVLAVKFREEPTKGHFLGGPFYYIENGLGKKWKWMAKLFAFFGAVAGLLGIGTMTQVNGIYEAAQNLFDYDKKGVLFTLGPIEITLTTVIVSVIVTFCAALVIIGGIKRIAKVSEIVVPFMAVTYIVFALIILIGNYKAIPESLGLIFRSAFDPSAVGGAITGLLLKTVIQKGVGRGIFSNEAGLGSSVMVHSNSNVKEPVIQGIWGIFEVFADTIIICTLTALAILTSGYMDLSSGKVMGDIAPSALTSLCFTEKFGNAGAIFITLALILFAFSTCLGWSHYGTKSWEYLLGTRSTMIYRVAFIACIMLGALMTSSLAWDISDTFNGLMALPNLIGVVACSGTVAAIVKNYKKRVFENEDIEPMYNFDPETQKKELQR